MGEDKNWIHPFELADNILKRYVVIIGQIFVDEEANIIVGLGKSIEST